MPSETESVVERVAKLEREVRGLKWGGVYLLFFFLTAVCAMVQLGGRGSSSITNTLSTRQLLVYGEGGDLSCEVNARAPTPRLTDAMGHVYWPSLVLQDRGAGKPYLVFSATQDGLPRLDLLDSAGRSLWHAP